MFPIHICVCFPFKAYFPSLFCFWITVFYYFFCFHEKEVEVKKRINSLQSMNIFLYSLKQRKRDFWSAIYRYYQLHHTWSIKWRKNHIKYKSSKEYWNVWRNLCNMNENANWMALRKPSSYIADIEFNVNFFAFDCSSVLQMTIICRLLCNLLIISCIL